MTLGSSIKQFFDNMARSLAITSANPARTNRVKAIDYFGESGNFDDIFRADVIGIIQEEIRIQLTRQQQPDTKDDTPDGSVTAQTITNVKKGISFVENPATAATQLIKFLPHAALVSLALSLVPIVIKHLTKPGGVFDVRWRRVIDEEFNGFLDRQTQKNTQIGIRGVQVQSRAGFISINGANNSNNLRFIHNGGINDNRLDRIGIDSFAKGAYSAR